jgi:hypothetical protein
MATPESTFERIKQFAESSIVRSWTLPAVGDTGIAVQNPTFSDRSVQVSTLTWGGSTVTIEGSNDGLTYFTLTDQAGAALTFTSSGLRQILQVCRYIRPKATGGTGTSFKIDLLMVRKA